MRTFPINVSKKVLANISSGIYRTPANALKEVVSNAFDAGAHRVVISTNVPYFDVFTCEDDGEGMFADEFKEIMKRIGSSAKRVEGMTRKKNGRPIIGKIGIGILSVAQICNKFSVISKKKGSKSYFHAQIDLRQFEDVEQERNYKKGMGPISLGTYEMEENLKDEVGTKRQYTKIVMEDLKKGFNKKLVERKTRERFELKEKAEASEDFVSFIESIKKEKFNEWSQYDQMIWELAMLCPVEYVAGGPLPKNRVLKEDMDRLENYDFKVCVDGYEIRKPINFPTDKGLVVDGADYKVYPRMKFKEEIDGTELAFTGYLFHQRKRIEPAELQGVLIRIKDVAIGSYDRTFLHYPKAEGPMFSQLSGEIFVESGLEEALNIDRNSFNETHEHYLELQSYLQEFLGGDDGVFKDIRKRSKERRDKERAVESKRELQDIRKVVDELLGIKVKVTRRKSAGERPFMYDRKKKEITLYSNPFWARNQKRRGEQEKLIVAIVGAKEKAKTVEEFEGYLLDVLARMG